MPIRIAVLSIDAGDPHRVADFWAGALGWDAWPDPGGGGVSLAPPGAPEASGALQPSTFCPVQDVEAATGYG